jgi:hypothetical protein
MNVTFRLSTEDLEKAFEKEATGQWPRRLERAPLRWRHARVDLQRVP